MRAIKVQALLLLALAVGIPPALPAEGPEAPKADEPRPLRKDRLRARLPPAALARRWPLRFRAMPGVLALSPDGRTILALSRGRGLGRWDLADGRFLGETILEGAERDGRCWFAPDRRTVAVPRL